MNIKHNSFDNLLYIVEISIFRQILQFFCIAFYDFLLFITVVLSFTVFPTKVNSYLIFVIFSIKAVAIILIGFIYFGFLLCILYSILRYLQNYTTIRFFLIGLNVEVGKHKQEYQRICENPIGKQLGVFAILHVQQLDRVNGHQQELNNLHFSHVLFPPEIFLILWP